MGYSHTWTAPKELDALKFQELAKDVRKLLLYCKSIELDVKGKTGEGEPTATPYQIAFNGNANCGHEPRNLGLPWPTEQARGITTAIERRPPQVDVLGLTLPSAQQGHPALLANDADIAGLWSGGVLVTGRTCDGSCAGEPFILRQNYAGITTVSHIEGQRIKDGCKTNFKPYDVVVTAVLLLVRHHFRDDVHIETDGLAGHWVDGYAIARSVFPHYDFQGVRFAY